MSTKDLDNNEMMLLTPGSIWVRKDGKRAKFLWLTNAKLSKKTQEAHPPQIVYAGDDDGVYNREVEEFFNHYKFHSVDPDLESKLENLLVFSEDDHDNEEAPDYDGDDVADVSDDEVLSMSDTGPVPFRVLFGTNSRDNAVASPVSAQELSAALALYSQEPVYGQPVTNHHLLFALGGNVTIENLQAAFVPNEEGEQRATMDAFQVLADMREDTVYWTSYVGVYPEYSIGGLYAKVVLGTDEYQVAEDSDEVVVDPSPLTEPEVEVEAETEIQPVEPVLVEPIPESVAVEPVTLVNPAGVTVTFGQPT